MWSPRLGTKYSRRTHRCRRTSRRTKIESRLVELIKIGVAGSYRVPQDSEGLTARISSCAGPTQSWWVGPQFVHVKSAH